MGRNPWGRGGPTAEIRGAVEHRRATHTSHSGGRSRKINKQLAWGICAPHSYCFDSHQSSPKLAVRNQKKSNSAFDHFFFLLLCFEELEAKINKMKNVTKMAKMARGAVFLLVKGRFRCLPMQGDAGRRGYSLATIGCFLPFWPILALFGYVGCFWSLLLLLAHFRPFSAISWSSQKVVVFSNSETWTRNQRNPGNVGNLHTRVRRSAHLLSRGRSATSVLPSPPPGAPPQRRQSEARGARAGRRGAVRV